MAEVNEEQQKNWWQEIMLLLYEGEIVKIFFRNLKIKKQIYKGRKQAYDWEHI